MALLPNVNAVRPSPRAVRPIAQISPGAAGATGAALQDFGGQLGQAADRMFEKQTTAAALERDTYASDQLRKLMYDPETGFMTKQGKSAVDAYGTLEAQLKQLEESTMAGTSPAVKRRLQERLRNRIDSAMQTAAIHTSGAKDVWLNGAADAAAFAAANDASVNSSLIDSAAAEIAMAVKNSPAASAWGAEQLEREIGARTSKLYLNRALQLADTVNPVEAKKFLEDNADKIYDKTALATLQGKLKPMADDYVATNAGMLAASGLPDPTSYVRYNNAGAVRNRAADPKLIADMGFLSGMGVTMEIISGGQPTAAEVKARGEGSRTGGVRHDDGKAVDADFYDKNGRRLDWNNPADRPIFEKIITYSVANGLTGVGAADDYMGAGRVHIGYGGAAVWGRNGKNENLKLQWVKDAFAAGMAMRARGERAPTSGGGLAAIDAANLTPEQRLLAYQTHDTVLTTRARAAARAEESAALAVQNLITGGTLYRNISPTDLSGLSTTSMRNLSAYSDTLERGDSIVMTPESWDTYTDLSNMMADEDRREEFKGLNLADYRNLLDDGHYEKVVDIQRQMRAGDNTVAAQQGEMLSSVNIVLEEIGRDPAYNGIVRGIVTDKLFKWTEANPRYTPHELRMETHRLIEANKQHLRSGPITNNPATISNAERAAESALKVMRVDMSSDEGKNQHAVLADYMLTWVAANPWADENARVAEAKIMSSTIAADPAGLGNKFSRRLFDIDFDGVSTPEYAGDDVSSANFMSGFLNGSFKFGGKKMSKGAAAGMFDELKKAKGGVDPTPQEILMALKEMAMPDG